MKIIKLLLVGNMNLPLRATAIRDESLLLNLLMSSKTIVESENFPFYFESIFVKETVNKIETKEPRG